MNPHLLLSFPHSFGTNVKRSWLWLLFIGNIFLLSLTNFYYLFLLFSFTRFKQLKLFGGVILPWSVLKLNDLWNSVLLNRMYVLRNLLLLILFLRGRFLLSFTIKFKQIFLTETLITLYSTFLFLENKETVLGIFFKYNHVFRNHFPGVATENLDLCHEHFIITAIGF